MGHLLLGFVARKVRPGHVAVQVGIDKYGRLHRDGWMMRTVVATAVAVPSLLAGVPSGPVIGHWLFVALLLLPTDSPDQVLRWAIFGRSFVTVLERSYAQKLVG